MKWSKSTNSFLGIAVGERTITAAEVSRARDGKWDVRRTAEFALPAEASTVASGTATEPASTSAVGESFGKFLQDNGFTAARAVIGVPARWIVARERELPPSSAEQAAEILRLQAERLFSAELGEVVFDYAGTADAAAARGVLLLAMPRRQLERVVRIVESAGRQVAAVTPSTLALSGGGGNGRSTGTDGLVLNLSEDAVELAAHRGGAPRLLRHLPVRGPDLASQNGTRAAAVSSLAGEIRRTVALMPRATDAAASDAGTLHLWDGIGLDAQDASALAHQSGLTLRPGGDAGAPAVALALSAASPRAGAVDFLHPRLAPAKRRRIGRVGAWAAGIAAAVLLALLVLWIEVEVRDRSLGRMNTRIKELSPQVTAAELTTNRISVARGWYGDARPSVLDCLREITAAFPENGEALYVTRFSLPESREGSFSGKGPSEQIVTELVTRLNQNPNFAKVTQRHNAVDSNRRSSEVEFTISFTYQPRTGATTATTTR